MTQKTRGWRRYLDQSCKVRDRRRNRRAGAFRSGEDQTWHHRPFVLVGCVRQAANRPADWMTSKPWPSADSGMAW